MEPICHGCRHFKQTNPLDYAITGTCEWSLDKMPEWLTALVASSANKRTIWNSYEPYVRTNCTAFQKPLKRKRKKCPGPTSSTKKQATR